MLLLAAAVATARVANLWYLGRIGLYSGEWLEHEADPPRGFDWPYRLYVPASVQERASPVRLLVRPNNTGTGPDDDFDVHHTDAAHLLEVSRWEAERIGVVVLVPSFPRPGQRDLWGTLVLDAQTIRHPRPMGHLDEQLLAMIDDARARLRERGLTVCDRVLMDGFSASAMFTSRFLMLHPERVQAVTVGAPGGWPMVPLAVHDGEPLPYPAGTADYAERFGRPFPARAVTRIPMLLYLGAHDDNDAVPYADSFPPDVADVVWRHFGHTPQARWEPARAAFAGHDATFRTYDDLGHEAPRAVRLDVLEFLAAHDEHDACAHR